MVTLLLVRHATTDDTGHRLGGRTPGMHLNAQGRDEAERLAACLQAVPADVVVSSPLERAMETATIIGGTIGVPVATEPELTEIDFGDWTGRTFRELAEDRAWQVFNTDPDRSRVPRGETLDAVARRGAGALSVLARAKGDGTMVVVSHGDVIRLAIARLLGEPLRTFRRREIDPGAVTAMTWRDQTPALHVSNWRPRQGETRTSVPPVFWGGTLQVR